MSSHTPGPWVALKTQAGDFQIKAQPPGTQGFTQLVAYADKEADALLIASAPDLLAALRK